jgi:hypothetical protein
MFNLLGSRRATAGKQKSAGVAALSQQGMTDV